MASPREDEREEQGQESRRRVRALRVSQTEKAAKAALARSFSTLVELSEWSRCSRPEESLLPSVPSELWPEIAKQLGGGDGDELRPDHTGAPKFCSAWSSAALAVNSIAPFLSPSASGLRTSGIPGIAGEGACRFEANHSAGIPGRRSPNLDFVIESEPPVFVESKATEYLKTSHPALKPVYVPRAHEVLGERSAAEVEAIAQDRFRYRLVDAPQLVKHLLAVRTWLRTTGAPRATLLYAYWEPSGDLKRFPAFAHHRDETDRLFDRINEPDIDLLACRWPDVWSRWLGLDSELARHVAALRSRYSVSLFTE